MVQFLLAYMSNSQHLTRIEAVNALDGDKCQDGVWASGSISRLRNWHGGAQVKLWDVSSEQPSLVAASDMGVGAIFSAAFCAESPFLVAAGGAKVSHGCWQSQGSCWRSVDWMLTALLVLSSHCWRAPTQVHCCTRARAVQ